MRDARPARNAAPACRVTHLERRVRVRRKLLRRRGHDIKRVRALVQQRLAHARSAAVPPEESHGASETRGRCSRAARAPGSARAAVKRDAVNNVDHLCKVADTANCIIRRRSPTVIGSDFRATVARLRSRCLYGLRSDGALPNVSVGC